MTPFPSLELKKLEAISRHKIFCMLIARGKISGEMVAMLSTWRHSGFHVFCGNRIQPKRRRRGGKSGARYHPGIVESDRVPVLK